MTAVEQLGRPRPLRRVRRWWCGRQHDKGYRLHAWEMIEEQGSIRCRRCGVVRKGFGPEGAKYMRSALAEYRARGLFR